jgi:hypothetical protein
LLTSLWPFKEHDSFKLRNYVSVSYRLVAVKSERPTKKVKSKAHKRRLTKNQCGITSPSKAKYQQRKLHQTPASEGLRITNVVSPPKLVRGAHPTKPMCHHLAVKGERRTKKVKPKAHKRRLTKNQCSITSLTFIS